MRALAAFREAELKALAEGLSVYRVSRSQQQEAWARMPLPPAYKAGIAFIRAPFTQSLEVWETTAKVRADAWRDLGARR